MNKFGDYCHSCVYQIWALMIMSFGKKNWTSLVKKAQVRHFFKNLIWTIYVEHRCKTYFLRHSGTIITTTFDTSFIRMAYCKFCQSRNCLMFCWSLDESCQSEVEDMTLSWARWSRAHQDIPVRHRRPWLRDWNTENIARTTQTLFHNFLSFCFALICFK